MKPGQSKKIILWATVLVLVVVIIIGTAIVVERHKSNNVTMTTAQINNAKQQIEQSWKTFFAYSTSPKQREDLLQNGNQFTQPIQTEFSSLGSAASSAEVKSINIINPTSANVIYTVKLNGQPVLSDQKGVAVLINNSWKVSDSTLCQLLGLAGTKPTVCQNI